MGDVVSFKNTLKGTSVLLFTSIGIFSGAYSGIEILSDSPWITLTDAGLYPQKSKCSLEEVIRFEEISVQMCQIISTTKGTIEAV